MFKWLLRLLYPPKCIFCGTLVDNDTFSVCKKCYPQIPFNFGRKCMVCDTPLDTVYGDKLCLHCKEHKRKFDKAFAPLLYKDCVRKAILGFKFYDKVFFAETFAAFILMYLRNECIVQFDCITYVPLHPKKERERGYNQTKLLANKLGKMMNLPVIPTLNKIVNTPPQSKKSRHERMRSLSGVFEITANADIKGKTILLIDDVLTTGTTLDVCAGILKRNGANCVFCTAIAVTPGIGFVTQNDSEEEYDTTFRNRWADSFW